MTNLFNVQYGYLLGIILLINCPLLFAQDSGLLHFRIEGKINADTGTVALNLFYDNSYYPEHVEKMIATVENNKFFFSGDIPYPQALTLSYGSVYSSRLFVIEPGNQSINIDIKANREVPQIDNQIMNEYDGAYAKAFNSIRDEIGGYNIKRDSLRRLYQNELPDSIKLDLEQEYKEIYNRSDGTLLKYVRTHPDSYAAFWKFIELFSFVGYENIYDTIFDQFSDSLKSTYAGKMLAEKLKSSGLTANGKKFPTIMAVDMENNKMNKASFTGNEFTFVDFWYSNCRPCIAQFPHLRETYEKYKDQGFEIIGISTDKISYEEMWQKAIEKYQLVWPQYWDKDGVESSRLSINKFPTNYMLDSQGKIIKKDLRPVELDQFLKDNMQ